MWFAMITLTTVGLGDFTPSNYEWLHIYIMLVRPPLPPLPPHPAPTLAFPRQVLFGLVILGAVVDVILEVEHPHATTHTHTQQQSRSIFA